MKLTAKLFIVLGSLVTSSFGATVAGTSFDFSGVPAVSGGVLIDGVAATSGQANANVGFFNSGFDVALAVANGDYAGLFTNFNIISSALVGNTTSNFGENYAGLYDTGGGAMGATAGSPSIGRSLFTFFSVGSSLSPLSIGNGSALVNSGQVVAVDAFPPTDYVLFPTAGTFINVSGASLTTSTFSAGALGIANQSAPAINIVPIPEPSAAILGALGALGLLRRRRA